MNKWEPYFKPTRRVHDSGFRCFECGYLVVGEDNKAKKKVVIAQGVDHISNWIFNFNEEVTPFEMDLLCDGNIRIFSFKQPLFWNIPGFSDANISPQKEMDLFRTYDKLDEIWEKLNNEESEK